METFRLFRECLSYRAEVVTLIAVAVAVQKNININFNCGKTRSSPSEEYLRVPSGSHNERRYPFRRYRKTVGSPGLLTLAFYRKLYLCVLHRFTSRFKSVQSDLRVAIYTHVKSGRFRAGGYFSLNPCETAKTILKRRENIFSHRAIKVCERVFRSRICSPLEKEHLIAFNPQ